MDGWRTATEAEEGEEVGGRAWRDRQRREGRSGETGRLTQPHSCRPDL